MKKFIPILFAILIAFASCENKGYPKPEQFLNEKQMVDILYDIHVGEALANRGHYNYADSLKIKSDEIYKAVLDKYQLNDSVLSLNIIYYSSRPKLYEKVYTKVIDRLNMAIEADKKKEDISVEKPKE